MPVFHEIESSESRGDHRGSVFGPKRIEFENGWNLNYGGRFARRMGAKAPHERSFRVVSIEIPGWMILRTLKGTWLLQQGTYSDRVGRKRPITHAATLVMLESISREPDRLCKECEPLGTRDGKPHKFLPAWEGMNEREIRRVLEAVVIPTPLWDSLCEEFGELL